MRDLEAARYAADRAFRQYDAGDPANRLVASELETRWKRALSRVTEIDGKIAAHDAAALPRAIAPISLATLADDLKSVWLASESCGYRGGAGVNATAPRPTLSRPSASSC